MKPENERWVKEQLQAVKARRAVGETLLRLLDTWEELEDDLNEQLVNEVLQYFGPLAKRHALVTEATKTWLPAGPGNIKVGDEVRVSLTAYTGDLGVIHNGRTGKVVAIRYGDVIVNSTDGKEPKLDGTHYSPHLLEKAIQA